MWWEERESERGDRVSTSQDKEHSDWTLLDKKSCMLRAEDVDRGKIIDRRVLEEVSPLTWTSGWSSGQLSFLRDWRFTRSNSHCRSVRTDWVLHPFFFKSLADYGNDLSDQMVDWFLMVAILCHSEMGCRPKNHVEHFIIFASELSSRRKPNWLTFFWIQPPNSLLNSECLRIHTIVHIPPISPSQLLLRENVNVERPFRAEKSDWRHTSTSKTQSFWRIHDFTIPNLIPYFPVHPFILSRREKLQGRSGKRENEIRWEAKI